MFHVVRTIVSPLKPLTVSHCDMVDHRGPCCNPNTHLPAPGGMRVCEPSNQPLPPSQPRMPLDITVGPTRGKSILYQSQHESSNQQSERTTAPSYVIPKLGIDQQIPSRANTNGLSNVDLVRFIKTEGMYAALSK